ncbi:MAG: glycosyltransferase family 2 protein [Candidatus Krumholzibacteria bacterium]|nr:glycosyltransferase family 2 protein [Candidatus Krumholzibacteria bacterium]
MDNSGHISIIIPAYNEKGSISGTIEEIDRVMKSHDYTYEVIVVDDGSTDGTAEMAKKQPSVRVIQHPYNRGYGASLKTGIKNARGEIILIIDADSTYPVDKIPLLLSQMNEYDMVVGARTSKDVKIQLSRKPAKWVLSKLANYLSGTRIPDLNSGLRAFKKEIALKFFNILPDQFSFTTTITLGMICSGYTIKYEPISYYRRVGKSKISPIRDTSNFILLIVRTVMYFNPLKIFLPISLFLFVLGIAMLCYDVFVIRNIGDKTVLLFSMALLIGAIGMLADLIVKKIDRAGT